MHSSCISSHHTGRTHGRPSRFSKDSPTRLSSNGSGPRRRPLPWKYIWFVLSLPLEMELLLSHNVTSIRKSTNTMLNGHWELPNARYISVNPVAFAADTLKATWWLIIDHHWSIGGCALTIKHDFPLLGPRIPYVNRIRR